VKPGYWLVEQILRRRVIACMAAGLHSLDGCTACGVTPVGARKEVS
jgi:hypothetical protein